MTRTAMRIPALLATTGLLAVFGLTACGGDDDSQDEPTTTVAMMDDTATTVAMMDDTSTTEAMMEETTTP